MVSLPAICHASHLEGAQNSWLSPNTRGNRTDYPEAYRNAAFCLQGGIKKVKAQLKPKLAKADKDKEKSYSKDTGNTRKTKKTVGPLFSDTGESGGCLPSPTPWYNGLDINKCEDGHLCVCESNKHNCLTGYMPKTGHAEEQEDCQPH